MNTRIDHTRQLEDYLYYECSVDNQTRSEIITTHYSIRLDFTRISRHMIMSKLKMSETNEQHELYNII